MIERGATRDKIIIAIYDFSYYPLGLAHILLWQAHLAILAHIHKPAKIEYCFLFDENELIYRLGFNDIKEFQKRFLSFWPVFFCLPFIRSINLFKDRLLLNQFISTQMANGSLVHPTLGNRKPLSFEILTAFSCQENLIPYLDPPLESKRKAEDFFKLHFPDSLVFCVSLKEPDLPYHEQKWQEFFKFFEKHPIVFLIVDEMETLYSFGKFTFPNVHMIENYNFTLCEKLAAINVADGFIGEIGSLALMAIFGKKPYIISQSLEKMQSPQIDNLSFLRKKHQTLLCNPTNTNYLITHLEEILKEL